MKKKIFWIRWEWKIIFNNILNDNRIKNSILNKMGMKKNILYKMRMKNNILNKMRINNNISDKIWINFCNFCSCCYVNNRYKSIKVAIKKL